MGHAVTNMTSADGLGREATAETRTVARCAGDGFIVATEGARQGRQLCGLLLPMCLSKWCCGWQSLFLEEETQSSIQLLF